MKHVRLALTSLVATAALCGCSEANKAAAAPSPAPTGNAQATRLANSANNSWITLNGRVISTTPTSFDLDYGSGRVTVEMDDWDWFQEGRALKPGDRVMVSGKIDNDLFEKKKIEAASVYVKNLGTHFFANPNDEEDLARTTIVIPNEQAFVGASGVVTEKEGTEFQIGGPTGVRVDTAKMADHPLDNKGLVQVKVGDRVQAWGDFNADPDERPEIMAKGLIVLSQDRAKTAPG